MTMNILFKTDNLTYLFNELTESLLKNEFINSSFLIEYLNWMV